MKKKHQEPKNKDRKKATDRKRDRSDTGHKGGEEKQEGSRGLQWQGVDGCCTRMAEGEGAGTNPMARVRVGRSHMRYGRLESRGTGYVLHFSVILIDAMVGLWRLQYGKGK